MVKDVKNRVFFFFHIETAPSGPRPPHYRGFTITLRHITFRRTPLEEWSVRRRDLYLSTHNTQKRQTSMPSAGFEPAIPASERPQTHALDRAATGIGKESTAGLISICNARTLQHAVIIQRFSNSKDVPVLNHHAMSVYVEMDTRLFAFLTLALCTWKWSASRPGRFTAG